MREILVQSDLVSVLLNLLFSIKYIYKTFTNTCIYIKILQIQCKYNKYSNKTIPETFL